MIFNIALSIVLGSFALGVVGSILSILLRNGDILFGSVMTSVVAGALPCALVLIAWDTHASDLSYVLAQDQVIQVQEERITSLTKRLNEFDYPEGALLNGDTPVAAIVTSLTNAETQLAEAKTERAKAIRSIEARRRGTMSGVIKFVGDYKD